VSYDAIIFELHAGECSPHGCGGDLDGGVPMSKPMGMSATFQIIRPTPIEDKIWDAVELAIQQGMSPKEFIDETRYCWQEYLREKMNDDRKEFERFNQ
jgi:hypothetical protein